MIYLQLFLEFAKVSIFCVGGGYASMPLIQAAVVDEYGWLTLAQFIDIFTISQMTPGPIGINAATFAGMKGAPSRRRRASSSRRSSSASCSPSSSSSTATSARSAAF